MLENRATYPDHPRDEKVTIVDENDRVLEYRLRGEVNEDPRSPIRRVSLVLIRDQKAHCWIGQIPSKGPWQGWLMPFVSEHVRAGESYRVAAKAGFHEELWHGRPNPFRERGEISDNALWYSGARTLLEIPQRNIESDRLWGRALAAVYVLFMPPHLAYEDLSPNPAEVAAIARVDRVTQLETNEFFDIQTSLENDSGQLKYVLNRLKAVEAGGHIARNSRKRWHDDPHLRKPLCLYHEPDNFPYIATELLPHYSEEGPIFQ